LKGSKGPTENVDWILVDSVNSYAEYLLNNVGLITNQKMIDEKLFRIMFKGYLNNDPDPLENHPEYTGKVEEAEVFKKPKKRRLESSLDN
jgi:hypothetical protein